MSRLTWTQEHALVIMLEADPDPIRGGMGMDGRYRKPEDEIQINSGTGSSLVRHGLAGRVDTPAGAKRGAWFRLTPEGLERARRARRNHQSPAASIESPQGVLHRHADGREHRHFSPGFTIGGQVRPDHDGTEEHEHSVLTMGGPPSNRPKSGPVVWHEKMPAAVTDIRYADLRQYPPEPTSAGTCAHCENDAKWVVLTVPAAAVRVCAKHLGQIWNAQGRPA